MKLGELWRGGGKGETSQVSVKHPRGSFDLGLVILGGRGFVMVMLVVLSG